MHSDAERGICLREMRTLNQRFAATELDDELDDPASRLVDVPRYLRQ